MKWKIPLYQILTDKEDIDAVTKVLKRGMDWAIGPEIIEFENALAKFVGSKYCLTFNSGTSALHASLLALGINSRDEVLVPSFTFISTVNSVLMVNALPKFIDIESNNYSADILYQPFDFQKKKQVIHFSLYERFLLAQLGFALTVIFDLVTTLGMLVFVPTWEGLLVSFITGFPFFTFHQLTNIILFSTIPSILVAINKAGPTI